MKSTQFLLGLLLVGFVQFVFCCGASTKKGSKTLTDNTNKNQVSPSLPSARCCKINKKKVIKQGSNIPLLASSSSTPSVAETPSNSSGQSIVKATHTTKQAESSKVPATPTTYYALNKSRDFQQDKDDPCMSCPVHHHPRVKTWLRSLPACPCHFSPSSLYDNNSIYDKIQRRLFSWRIVNAKYEMLSVFKPTAEYCIRQLPNAVTAIPTTQQCCYDRKSRLITRGSGAGTPNLVAPELDFNMHKDVDMKPFILCQGDWTRYQAVRSPNNEYNCTNNPGEAEFLRQVKKATDF